MMQKLLEKPEEEIIGKTCWELLHGRRKAIDDCPLVRMKKTLQRETAIVQLGHRWLEVTVDPIFDDSGDLVSAVHVISDVTTRKDTVDQLKHKTSDLTLVNSVNEALNQGQDVQEIIGLFCRLLRKTFHGTAVAAYLLSDDGKSLIMENTVLSQAVVKPIEKLLRLKIGRARIPLRRGGFYQEVLKQGRPRLSTDQATLNRMIADFGAGAGLSRRLSQAIASILKTAGIESVLNIPLVSDGTPLGLVDLSRSEPFLDSELKRLKVLAEQLTSAIKSRQTAPSHKRDSQVT